MDGAELFGVLTGMFIGGALFGLIPLIVGRRKGQKELGARGLLSCGIAAAVVGALISPLYAGLSAILVCGVFTWMIFRAEKEAEEDVSPKQ